MRESQRLASRHLLTMLMLLTGVAPARAQRSVNGTVLTSSALPPVVLRLDSVLTYVGSQKFTLGTADAEQYVFVKAEGARIRRLYWVQFEGYRDAFHRYDYSADSTIDVDGRTFHVSARFYPPSGFAGPPGSDGDRAARLLEREGYELAPDLARVRLVWLWDDRAQHEVMIIYVEDLAAHGVTLDSLRADPARWVQFRGGLVDRALEGVTIRPSP